MKKVLSYSVVAGEYERLIKVDNDFDELKTLLDKNDPEFVTVTMIAKTNDISRQEVLNKPWHLPDFGKVETEGKGRKKRFWNYEEYLDWIAIPEHIRIQDYRELTT